MKFTLWLERREKRNQRTATKGPKKKTAQELLQRAAGARIHQMSGMGNEKTYGKAGSSDSEKIKSQGRSRSKQQFLRNLRSED